MKEYTIKNTIANKCHYFNDTMPIVTENGSKFYYLNGKLHREDGPAIEYVDGDKYWYNNGHLHREDGPAVEYCSGSKFWYHHGILHREDGPAIEYDDGSKDWYLNGKLLTEKEHKNSITNNISQYKTEFQIWFEKFTLEYDITNFKDKLEELLEIAYDTGYDECNNITENTRNQW